MGEIYALILLGVVQKFEGKFGFCIIVIKKILISFISCSFFIFSVLYYIKVCLNNITFILLFLVSLRLFWISYEFFCLALIFFFTHDSCLMLYTKFYVELWSLHENSKTLCWNFLNYISYALSFGFPFEGLILSIVLRLSLLLFSRLPTTLKLLPLNLLIFSIISVLNLDWWF